jgi:hypothetical protein
MSLEHLQQRLQDTNALIVQVENALSLPENKKNSRSLSANLQSLHNMRERLEEQFLELAMTDGNPEHPEGQHLNCTEEPVKVGKKAAGRLLDGRQWNEYPK